MCEKKTFPSYEIAIGSKRRPLENFNHQSKVSNFLEVESKNFSIFLQIYVLSNFEKFVKKIQKSISSAKILYGGFSSMFFLLTCEICTEIGIFYLG